MTSPTPKQTNRSESFWLAFEKFALVFSFSVNIVLLVAVLVLLGLLIPIKNQVARPIVDQVMGEIHRLGDTHIQTTVTVEDEIQVKFDLPLNQEVNVTTTAPVPLTTDAYFTLPGGGGYIRGTVSIELPANTTLPVLLNTTVPVDQKVPVKLSVPVDINLGDTDLKAVVDSFEELLQPIDDLLGE
ncbi:MAG: hypothetical protein ACOYZ7_16935 [Chloroflexota bacterium]